MTCSQVLQFIVCSENDYMHQLVQENVRICFCEVPTLELERASEMPQGLGIKDDIMG